MWDDIINLAQQSILKIPDAVFLEIESKDDSLFSWLKSNENLLCEYSNDDVQRLVSNISNRFPNLSRAKLPGSKNFADPFVIAMAQIHHCAVVCHENLSGNLTGPKMPDVCNELGIRIVRFPFIIREQRLQYS